jgi:hypothetical protein
MEAKSNSTSSTYQQKMDQAAALFGREGGVSGKSAQHDLDMRREAMSHAMFWAGQADAGQVVACAKIIEAYLKGE